MNTLGIRWGVVKMKNLHPWYKVTGAPLHPAILWNDTRTESVLKDILQPELALRDILQPESILRDRLQSESVLGDRLQQESVLGDRLQLESVLGDRLQPESVLVDRLDTNPSSQTEQRIAGRLNIFKSKKRTF